MRAMATVPTTACLILCSLCLAVASGSSVDFFGGSSSTLEAAAFVPRNRFGRLLKADLNNFASYLVPSIEPQLCTNGTSCCQADDYGSPYRLQQLNSTQNSYGGRTYTTFFFNLLSQSDCDASADLAGCCSASVSTVWIDVDPALKVKYATYNGQPYGSITASQTDYGFSIAGINAQHASFPAAGVPLTVTVEGSASQLCPPASLAPVPGYCEVVIEGGTSTNSGACCPNSLTQPLPPGTVFLPPADPFTCTSDMSLSGFQLAYEGAGEPYTVDGSRFLDYTMTLKPSTACDANAIGSCCDSKLSYLELKTADVAITSIKLSGVAQNFNSSFWNEETQSAGDYRSVIISDMNLSPADLSAAGSQLVITLALPADANSPSPDLCDASLDPSTGACSYYLHSEDGFCCPAGLANPAHGGAPPPGSCAPTLEAAYADTSMSLQYWERAVTPTNTTFNFLVADLNGPGCNKAYCTDVCGWTLYVQPSIASLISIEHEDLLNDGGAILTPGSSTAPASVTFTYGPTADHGFNYFLTLPSSSARLAQLCAPNALPGQGSKSCAAVLRSGGVYVNVFFDEDDVVIRPNPSEAQLCPNAAPMETSCVRVDSARFNSDAWSTVVDFTVSTNSALSGCVSEPADTPLSLHVLLQPPVAEALQAKKQLSPSNSATVDSNSGLTWKWTPKSGAKPGVSHYSLNLAGILSATDVCLQGVLPNQPPRTCVVEIIGSSGCFRAFIPVSPDPSLSWDLLSGSSGSSKGASAAVVAPAVILPVFALLAAGVAGGIFVRRKRKQRASQFEPIPSDAGSSLDMHRPLNTDGGAPGENGSCAGGDDELSVASAAPSDVHIRVPGASTGGTCQ